MEEEKGPNPVEGDKGPNPVEGDKGANPVEGEEEAEAEAEVEAEAEETAAEAPTAESPQTTPELKVVLQIWGTRAIVGIQGTNTDPVVETLETASLEELLAAVPGVLARARERWATSPRNPKYVGPPAPPPATPAPGKPAGRASRPPAAPTPRMFE